MAAFPWRSFGASPGRSRGGTAPSSSTALTCPRPRRWRGSPAWPRASSRTSRPGPLSAPFPRSPSPWGFSRPGPGLGGAGRWRGSEPWRLDLGSPPLPVFQNRFGEPEPGHLPQVAAVGLFHLGRGHGPVGHLQKPLLGQGQEQGASSSGRRSKARRRTSASVRPVARAKRVRLSSGARGHLTRRNRHFSRYRKGK